ncbi:MAG: DMT family transporter [Dysgonomonas sp.]|jgi:drug/metabolite transporter (DMT)-like permease|uniref:DMT family transporter n=1 Tax=unclassified Dysgonomonas TaxID=2630389 RepID=UPI0025C2AA93|nr:MULTISPECIES: DMT family transporter [unclassified Dysgonomonas]MDR1718140.1 DMT family transporter [Prevotella sp.]MDR2003286.1 DMT family transporter [Prevotella sp.]HMM03054.1 DMT family transporter [Dysgonomonas sp.]
MTLSQKQQGHIIMFVVMTVFGLNIPINKYLYSTGLLTPIAMTMLRMGFAAIAFWIVSLFTKKEKVDRRDLLILCIGGISGMLINQSLFAYGLGQTSSVDASIITTSGPLFAMILAAVLLKEPITFKKAGGVLLGGLGAIFLVYTSNQVVTPGQGSALAGDIAVLGAQLFYAFYLVITRPLSTKYSPITMMKWMFLFAALINLPVSYDAVLVAPLFHQPDVIPYLMLSFTLLGATFFTYMMIPLAQRRIRPTTISMYNNMQPLIASGVAIYMGMDRFTFEKLLAAILIFGGVYLVTASKSRADVERESKTEQS